MLSRLSILILAAQHALGLPEKLYSPLATCTPTIKTTAVVVTYESLITISHSCYSYTATIPSLSGCPTYSCPPAPDCVLLSTTTTYVPSKDPCCETTGTTIVEGPCSSCQTGCLTELVVATVTTTEASVTTSPGASLTETILSAPKLFKMEPQSLSGTGCTTTKFYEDEWATGPTKTAYAWTEAVTSYVDCGGCEFVEERNINGLGPVVFYTTTYNDPEPTTTTDYLCVTLG